MANPRRRRTSAIVAFAFLLVGIGVAVGATWSVFQVLEAYRFELKAAKDDRPEEQLVIVAARTIAPGHVIRAEDLANAEIRVEYIPTTAMAVKEDVVGRTAIEHILPGELIRVERLASAEASSGFNAIIPTGLRALSINVNGAGQVSGFINPGNRVDLLVTVWPDPTDPDEAETNTLLQDVRVLAVDDRTEESAIRGVKLKPQVTLAVDPEFAEKITHALRQAKVKLVLRSDVDSSHFGERGTLTSELLGGEKPGARMTVHEWRVAVGLEPESLTIIHGDEVTTERR